MTESETSAPSSSSSSFGVPAAIIIAGGLIALAIYFGGVRPNVGSNEVAGTQGTAAPVAPTAQEPVIGDIRPVSDTDHVRGPASAKVTVIEYSDLECPFCKRFHPTMQQLVKEYPQDVRWVYRHFPLEQLHSQAKQEAIATECAGEQGKFWELTDKIYEVTPANDGLVLTDLPKLAREAGVPNIAQFESCLSSGKYAQRIEEDLADAEAAGGRGTPYSVAIGPDGTKKAINGAQSYATVKATVEELLKPAS